MEQGRVGKGQVFMAIDEGLLEDAVKRSRDGRSLGRFGVGLPPQRVQDAVFLQGLCKACLALRAVIGQDDLGGRGRIGPQAQGGAKRRPGGAAAGKKTCCGHGKREGQVGLAQVEEEVTPQRQSAPEAIVCMARCRRVCVAYLLSPFGAQAMVRVRPRDGVEAEGTRQWLGFHTKVCKKPPWGGAALDFSDAPCGSVLWGHTCAWRRRRGGGCRAWPPPQRRQARAQGAAPTRARAGPRSAQYRFEPSLRIFEGRVIAQRCPKAATRWKTPG